jgi:hypothetical protein
MTFSLYFFPSSIYVIVKWCSFKTTLPQFGFIFISIF